MLFEYDNVTEIFKYYIIDEDLIERKNYLDIKGLIRLMKN